MITTSALRSRDKDRFSVVWDTGRFCNYDCTYCEATRHNNFSKHKSLEEFLRSFAFIQQWTNLYNERRIVPASTSINFTGGEPTANPNFWPLLDHIESQDEKYDLSLTTNGAWGPKFSKRIEETFNSVTISYHAEAAQHLKDRAVENILRLHESSVNLQVNMMLHVDYWEECTELYTMLKAKGITVNPRPIGDGNIVRKGWFIDSDGTNRRTSHEYNEEQQAWFFNEVGVTAKPSCSAEGNQLGRKCCANIPMEGKVDGQWQPVKFINTEFKDWYCTVDWYFLYIDQETDKVYHHQTCKALYDRQRGHLGDLTNPTAMLDALKERLSQPEIKAIICPNPRCGCGMCAPKSQNIDDFKQIQQTFIKYE